MSKRDEAAALYAQVHFSGDDGHVEVDPMIYEYFRDGWDAGRADLEAENQKLRAALEWARERYWEKRMTVQVRYGPCQFRSSTSVLMKHSHRAGALEDKSSD